MDNTRTAQFIASAILANCEQYHAGTVTHQTWSDEQSRLWKMAERRKAVKHAVVALVFPPMGGR